MLSPSEIVGLFFAFGVFLFIVMERPRLANHEDARLATMAFLVLCTGWVLTVLEGFLWREMLNLLEHLCYAAGTGLLALWCWRRSRRGGEP